MVLVDANVLIDILSEDEKWFGWSSDALLICSQENALAMNALIFAEVCVGYSSLAHAEQEMSTLALQHLEIPYEAAWLAGQAFAAYRRRGGTKRSPLPDFYIGAHAVVKGMTLLTRDAGRYRSCFPGIRLVCPED